MNVDLVLKLDAQNRLFVEFGGAFFPEDLEAGFPCEHPSDPDNDALFKELIQECSPDDDGDDSTRTDAEKAGLAEIIGRAARAVANARRAATLDGEVIGPNPQP